MEDRIVRGAIFYADLNPIIGSEQDGTRPVLIVQNDIGNKHSRTVIVAPISTKKKLNMPTHVLIKDIDKVRYNSIIMLEQVRVLDKSRLKEYVATLNRSQMKEVEDALRVSFSLF